MTRRWLPALLSLAIFNPEAFSESIPIEYKLSRDANVSIHLSNSEGEVIRELLHGAPRKAGSQQEAWDGLDENGQPVPAGVYTWKLLSTQGLNAEYLVTLGTNHGRRWERWPGNHNGASTVLADESGIYIGGPGEGTPPIIKESSGPEGSQRLWGVPHWFEPWQGPLASALIGQRLYLHQGNGRIFIVDRNTGERLGDWATPFQPDENKPLKHYSEMRQAADIAGRGETLVRSLYLRGVVQWLDPENGSVLEEASLPHPNGVAVDDTGAVLVLSEDRLLKLTRGGGKPVELVKSGVLNGAFRLDAALDGSGDIIVAESVFAPWGDREGEPGSRILRFSKDGELLATYGNAEGRSRNAPHYEPEQFLGVGDLSAHPDGGFLISEAVTPPRRTARFDRQGRLVREWYGGQMYANHVAADPNDPTTVWLDTQWGSLIRAKVDFQEKAWKIERVHTYSRMADGLISNVRHGGARWIVMRRGEHRYLVLDKQAPTILKVDEETGDLQPIVVSKPRLYTPWNKDPWSTTPEWMRDMIGDPEKQGGLKVGRSHPHFAYIWTDANGDGLPQREEIRFEDAVGWATFFVDRDFNYYYARPKTKTLPGGIFRLAPTSWSEEGIPQYPALNEGVRVGDLPEDRLQDETWQPNLAGDPVNGGWYGWANTRIPQRFGVGFWGGRVGGNRVARWDREGKLQWIVGRHAPAQLAKPGEAKNLWKIVGTVHDTVVVGDVEHGMLHVWDRDGLWVGRLLENPDLRNVPKEAYDLCGENFGNTLYHDPATGEVLLFASGINDSPVYRITGWDQFERQQGQVTLADSVASRLEAQAKQEMTREGVIRIGAIDRFRPDGKLNEWNGVEPILFRDGEEIRAKLRLARHRNNLVAAWEVFTDTPWKNASRPELAFQGGASVAFSFGEMDPPPTDKARPGDVRLVFATIRHRGKDENRAMAYYPKLLPKMREKFTRPNQPTYETGNGSQTLEHFHATSSYREMAVVPTETGYIVELAITSHFNPYLIQPGTHLRFDASLQLADPSGTRTTLRLPWHSREAADMATEDVYTESLLRPKYWGELRAE